MKKRRFILPVLAVTLAIGAAFAAQHSKSELLANVEYKNANNQCVTHPQCSTTPGPILCSNTFASGTNCLTPIASWRPM